MKQQFSIDYLLSNWNKTQIRLLGIWFIIMLVLPLFIDSSYILHIFIATMIYIFVAQSWNILAGLAGQLSIGHIMYFGVGGYITTLLFVNFNISTWIGLLAAAVGGGLLGLFVSAVVLRYGLKEDYYALFTLAMSQMLLLIFMNLPFAGGAEGIYVPFRGSNFLNLQFESKLPFYYIILLLVLLLSYFVYRLMNTKMGLYFIAIRENEMAAEAIGIDIVKYKRYATILSGALTAVGGGLFTIYTAYAEPNLVFGFSQNFEFIIMAVVGGKGTIFGPIIGTMFLKPLNEFLRAAYGGTLPGLAYLIYGGVLAIIILFLPSGFMGLFRRLLNKFKKN